MQVGGLQNYINKLRERIAFGKICTCHWTAERPVVSLHTFADQRTKLLDARTLGWLVRPTSDDVVLDIANDRHGAWPVGLLPLRLDCVEHLDVVLQLGKWVFSGANLIRPRFKRASVSFRQRASEQERI